MAIVIRSKRDFNMSHNTTGVIGPGEYLDSNPLLNSNENITQNIVPFNTKSDRNFEFSENINTKVGPGCYYQPKYSSFIKKSFGKYNNRIDKMGSSDLYDLAIYKVINKKKMMKIKDKESLKIDKANKSQVFNSSNISNKNNNSFIESQNIYNKKYTLVPTTLTKNRVSSIPSKNFYLGYNLDDNGYLAMIDPSTLENEKNINSVKNINNKKILYRNISSCKSKINCIDWSKMSKKNMYTDQISTKDNSNMNNNSKSNNNSSSINNNNNSTNENNIKKSNLTTHSAYNIINKTNTTNDKVTFALIQSTGNNSIGNNYNDSTSYNEPSEISTSNKLYRSLSEETLTNKNNKIKGNIYKTFDKNYSNKFNDFTSLEEFVYDNLFKAQPGPGYYKEKSDFDKYLYLARNKRLKYNFGSNAERKSNSISNTKKNVLGPGSYFKEDNTPKKIINLHPFSKKENTINIQKNQKDFYLENLGPGKYDIKSEFDKTLKYYSGPLEKRFFNIEKKTPGPGEYLPLYNWNEQNNESNAKMFQFLINTKNKFNKENIKEEQGRHGYIPKNDNPGVGDYNPHLLQSIKYDIISKDNKFSNLIAPFYSGQEKYPKKCASTSDLLGPGCYFPKKEIRIFNKEEKKWNKKILNDIYKAEKIKFIYNQNKNEMVGNVGPGSYERDNYGDWNKRSFNVLYV